MARTIIIPAKYFKISRTKATRGTRDKISGRMTGREATSGKGDETYTRRAIRDVDLNKDGKFEAYRGEIFGRVSKTDVKSSKRAKGYIRQI